MSAPTLETLQAGQEIRGTVKRIELYGAFVDIGVGNDALLHISQLGKANVRNVEDVVKAGEEITVYILKVDTETKRIAISLVKPPAIDWDNLKEGDILDGEVERIENFGAFINIGAERPGMVHVSEMAEGFVKSPSDVVKVGEKVKVRVLKINRKKRQIDLSMKEPEEKIEAFMEEEDEDLPTAMALALRKALSQDGDEEDTDTFVSSRKQQRKDRANRRQDDIVARTLRNHK